MVARDKEEEGMESSCLMGTGFHFGMMKVLELDRVGGFTTL